MVSELRRTILRAIGLGPVMLRPIIFGPVQYSRMKAGYSIGKLQRMIGKAIELVGGECTLVNLAAGKVTVNAMSKALTGTGVDEVDLTYASATGETIEEAAKTLVLLAETTRRAVSMIFPNRVALVVNPGDTEGDILQFYNTHNCRF